MAKASSCRGQSVATEPQNKSVPGDWPLSTQSSAAVFTTIVCCSLSSRRYVHLCVSVCVIVCLPFPLRPREYWEFSVSVRQRILAGALLILSLLILCCCSKGGKKIEALAMAART